MPIAQKTTAQNKKSPDQPCTCGSGVFWLDPYRGFHCGVCDPPPTPKMIRENLVLVPNGEKLILESVSNARRERQTGEQLAALSEKPDPPIGPRGRDEWESWWRNGHAALIAMERAPAAKAAPESPEPAPAPEVATQAPQRPRPKAPPHRSPAGA